MSIKLRDVEDLITPNTAENEYFGEKSISDFEDAEDDDVDGDSIPDELENSGYREEMCVLVALKWRKYGSSRNMSFSKLIRFCFSIRSKVCLGLSEKYRDTEFANPYELSLATRQHWPARKPRLKSFEANDLEHGRICGIPK